MEILRAVQDEPLSVDTYRYPLLVGDASTFVPSEDTANLYSPAGIPEIVDQLVPPLVEM